VAANIQSRVTPGIPVNGVRTGRWRRSRRSGKVSSGPGLVGVTGADPVGPHLSRALVGGVRWWRGSERFAEVLLLGWTLCSR
jgi:hypothetical protein